MQRTNFKLKSKKVLSLALAMLMLMSCMVSTPVVKAADNNCTVTFFSRYEGASSALNVEFETLTIAQGEILTKEAVDNFGTPTKASDTSHDYAFSFWSNVTDEVGKETKVNFPIVVTEDMQFMANYEVSATKTFTVTFLDNDGTELARYSDLAFNSFLTDEMIPNLDGKRVDDVDYVFTGWSQDVDRYVQNTVTYTAQYDEYDVTYKVVFMYDEDYTLRTLDFVIPGEDVYYTGKTPEKPYTSAGHYDFVGWTSDRNDSFNESTDGVKIYENVQSDVVLYAKFRLNKHEYRDSVQTASCTNDGGILHQCIYCDYNYMNVEQPAYGHDYRIIQESEIDANGMKTYTYRCETCGHTYQYKFQIKDVKKFNLNLSYSNSHTAVDTAKVTVDDKNGNRMVTTYGDESGKAYFELTYAGVYTVTISSRHIKEPYVFTVTVTEDQLENNITIDELVKVQTCECTCHKTGTWPDIFRFLHIFFSKFLGGKISCCPDPDPLYDQIGFLKK